MPYMSKKNYDKHMEFLEGCIKSRVNDSEWIFLGNNPYSKHKWSCKKCGHGVKEQENYCSNCGSKMHKELDFPNSHKKKGGNTANTGSRFF